MILQNANSNTSTRLIENGMTIYDVMRKSLDNLVAQIFDRLPYIIAGVLVLILFWLLAKFFKKLFWSDAAFAVKFLH